MNLDTNDWDILATGCVVATTGILCAKQRAYGKMSAEACRFYFQHHSGLGRPPWRLPYRVRHWTITLVQMVGLTALYLLMRELSAEIWDQVDEGAWIATVSLAVSLVLWATAESAYLGYRRPDWGLGLYGLAAVSWLSAFWSARQYQAWRPMALMLPVGLALAVYGCDTIEAMRLPPPASCPCHPDAGGADDGCDITSDSDDETDDVTDPSKTQ